MAIDSAWARLAALGTVGLTFAKVSLDSSVTVGGPPIGSALTGSEDATKSGWTAGRGLQLPSLYYDLGNISVQSTHPQQVLFTDQDVNGLIARGGIDYRF